jgi:hypothetical protein
MARVRLVPRDEITDEFVLDRWDQTFGDSDPATDDSMIGPNGTRGDYWAALANSPQTVQHVWDGFAYLKSHTLARVYREVDISTLSLAAIMSESHQSVGACPISPRSTKPQPPMSEDESRTRTFIARRKL